MNGTIPCSPKIEIDGLVYFPRLCEKIRLHAAGKLWDELHGNLGSGMDLWTCQFLGVDYDALAEQVRNGASDHEALAWARKQGISRPDHELAWWNAYIRTRGFRDDLAERLAQRIKESGFGHRDDILTFMDYIDADEGRS
jgi:gluconokinase